MIRPQRGLALEDPGDAADLSIRRASWGCQNGNSTAETTANTAGSNIFRLSRQINLL